MAEYHVYKITADGTFALDGKFSPSASAGRFDA